MKPSQSKNHTTASYVDPKVGQLRRCGTGGVSGRWMDVVKDKHRWQTLKCLFTHSDFLKCVFVCVCLTPNLYCHILFPAKHLAAAQDNWLISAEVIMLSINSSQQGLTPKPYILRWCISTAKLPCGISLTPASTNVMCFQSRRARALICYFETTIACWNTNLPCKVPFRGPYYLTGFHL